MENYIWQIVYGFATAAIGWVFSKLLTRREQKKTDLEIINSSIKPLLESIADLTSRLKEVTTQLLTSQDENLALRLNKTELLGKIDHLEQQVHNLTELLKQYTQNETPDSPDVAPAELVRPGKTQRRSKR